MAIETAYVRILGTRLLLFNNFSPAILSSAKRVRSGTKGNDPEEWRKTFLCTPERQLYIRPECVSACLRDAAKYTKSGRASLQSALVATLQVTSSTVLFNRYVPENLDEVPNDPNNPIYVDVRAVRNPGTNALNLRYRLALSPGWEAEFAIAWDNTIISRTQMLAILNDAGSLIGLSDGRKLGLGRFMVEEVTVDAQKAPA